MNDVKKKLLQEIDDRIAKRKEAKARAIQRNTVEAFVLAFISDVEDINMVATTTHTTSAEWQSNVKKAITNLKSNIRSFDWGVNLEVSWYDQEDKFPIVNGVTIKWSMAHQTKENCEPELFIDVTELLFK